MSKTQPATPARTMRAVVNTQHAASFSDALAFTATHPLPAPDAAKCEVRVRVAYAATNPCDVRMARGDFKAVLTHPLPCPVGRDFSGWVDEIPFAVDALENPAKLAVGDRVCGYLDHEHLASGSMAEYVVAPIKILAKIPSEVTLRTAAGLPLVGITMHVTLLGTLKLAPHCGKKMLVLGGSSSNGMLALQLARHYGCAEVACTSTSEALCTRLGATRVIDYRRDDWWGVLAGADYDCILDTVGGADAFELSHHVLKKGGQYATIVGDLTTGPLTIGAMLKWMCCVAPCRGGGYAFTQGIPCTADPHVAFWLGLVRDGAVTVVEDDAAAYTLDKASAVAMLEKQASGRCKGKLIMNVGDHL